MYTQTVYLSIGSIYFAIASDGVNYYCVFYGIYLLPPEPESYLYGGTIGTTVVLGGKVMISLAAVFVTGTVVRTHCQIPTNPTFEP